MLKVKMHMLSALAVPEVQRNVLFNLKFLALVL